MIIRSRRVFYIAFVFIAVLAVGMLVRNVNLTNKKTHVFSVETKPIDVKSGVRPVSFENDIETNLFSEGEFVVPFDGFIGAFNPEPINAPRDSLRYTFAYKIGDPDPICPSTPRRIHVMSIEYNDLGYFSKFGFGYPVKKGERILISSAFANFGKSDQYDTRTKVSIQMVEAKENLIPITPVYLNVVPCTSLFFVDPKKYGFEKSMDTEYEVPFDSKIIMAGSHMHSFADEIVLTKNGKSIWTAKSALTDKGLNAGNPVYLNLGGYGYVNEGLQLKKGDKLGLTVKYTNPNNKKIDAMGTMLIFLRPDDGTKPAWELNSEH